MVASGDQERDRRQFVELAMQVTEKRGEQVSRAMLAAEAGVSRALVERYFPEEDDLFNAIVDLWYEPDVEIMEAVIASDLPIRRKFYEFFARRYLRERQRYEADPATFALYCELGSARFEDVRGYIDLADHYLSQLIAEAQDDGFFPGLTISEALSLVNQMVIAYTSPQVLMHIVHRLEENKLAAIIDTIFGGGLTGEAGTSAQGTGTIRIAS